MRFTSRLLPMAAVSLAAMGMAACTNTPLYGNDGSAGAAPVGGYSSQQGYAQWGQVTSVQLVRGERSSGTIGTIAGGAAGGLAGHQIGGGTGKTVATVAGAIGGALIGRAIEQNTRQPGEDHYRVTVRLEDGSNRNFDYRETPDVREGDRVRVDGNQLYR